MAQPKNILNKKVNFTKKNYSCPEEAPDGVPDVPPNDLTDSPALSWAGCKLCMEPVLSLGSEEKGIYASDLSRLAKDGSEDHTCSSPLKWAESCP